MKKGFNRGFTLIELLVVIAIIGVLSAVVLSQLNSARNKGADAAAKSAFKNLASSGQFYYDALSTYNGICTHDGTPASPPKFQSIYTPVGGVCNNSALGYRVRVQLKLPDQFGSGSGTDWLCTDANGNYKILDNDPGGTAITC